MIDVFFVGFISGAMAFALYVMHCSSEARRAQYREMYEEHLKMRREVGARIDEVRDGYKNR